MYSLPADRGACFRASGPITSGVTCTVRYGDRSAARRNRTLAEATQHAVTALLARAAYVAS